MLNSAIESCRASGRTEVEKERDSELVKVRRLEKTCDKYCKELELSRAEIVELKAQLLESTKFQVIYCCGNCLTNTEHSVNL